MTYAVEFTVLPLSGPELKTRASARYRYHGEVLIRPLQLEDGCFTLTDATDTR